VAAQIEREHNEPVKVVPGRVLEFSVRIGGETVFTGNPLWYPRPSSVIRRVREILQRPPIHRNDK